MGSNASPSLPKASAQTTTLPWSPKGYNRIKYKKVLALAVVANELHSILMSKQPTKRDSGEQSAANAVVLARDSSDTPATEPTAGH
ncbi:hypothetical protein SK128_027148 [Halocaridina rubra]|uniref:Uncharacterized protein n=1 Tax=Halocaridina rubra TaxID=373956 RepID=A0AAN8X5L3_HALRR